MYSPTKKLHKELLLEVADTITAVAKIPTAQATVTLEELGKLYIELEQKIQTKDYTQDDYYLERFNELLCRTTKPIGTT